MSKSDLQPGDHFWAVMDHKLLVMMKDSDGEYLVCGGWECAILEEGFEFIELIKRPIGHEKTLLYYL